MQDQQQSAAEIQLRDAEAVIDAMTQCAEMEGTLDESARFKLRTLIELMDRPHTIATMLLIESFLKRSELTVPLRFTYAGSVGLKPIFHDEALDEGMREAATLLQVIIPRVMHAPRVPQVMVCGVDTPDQEWVKRVYRPRLAESGYHDILLGAWSAITDRMITMSVMRLPDDPPFTDYDRMMLSLMMRAAAPFVDREALRYESALAEHDLTDRQREVLLLLLAGDSEKEVARRIHRSVHTVHTFVKQLYDRFGVSSRGELMAHFIDESVSRLAREYVTELEDTKGAGGGQRSTTRPDERKAG